MTPKFKAITKQQQQQQQQQQ